MKIEWKKYKKIGNTFLTVIFVWFLLALSKTAKNDEFSKIVRSIAKFEETNECELEIKVERNWILSWTPQAMDVAMSKEKNSIQIRTYAMFPPDRIEQDHYEYLYRYKTNGRKDGLMVSKYLHFEMDRNKALKWIEMGECKGIDEEEYWINRDEKNYDICTDPILRIRCENA